MVFGVLLCWWVFALPALLHLSKMSFYVNFDILWAPCTIPILAQTTYHCNEFCQRNPWMEYGCDSLWTQFSRHSGYYSWRIPEFLYSFQWILFYGKMEISTIEDNRGPPGDSLPPANRDPIITEDSPAVTFLRYWSNRALPSVIKGILQFFQRLRHIVLKPTTGEIPTSDHTS